MNALETLMPYLPLIIPAFAVQVILAVIALVHVFKHPTYRFGNRAMWIVIVLLVNIIGPILYFVLGRGEDS